VKLVEILNKAQVLSGVGVFEGNAVDVNLASTCTSILHETLNDINNDPRVTLAQKTLDYQTHTEEASAPDALFPGAEALPFPIAATYPLPGDCRRVLKAMNRSVELRKTDFSEIVRGRSVAAGMLNMYAVNGNAIELVRPSPIVIVYVKEFGEFMPQDEVDMPHIALSYLINLAAYNIALAFNESAAERCRVMAEKSLDSLLANLRVNAGSKYINPMLAMSRFDDAFGMGAWL